jgi:large subunit ribosomal protein L21
LVAPALNLYDGPSASSRLRREGTETMYAVISTGGKQYRVTEGQQLDVERLGATEGEVELRPVLLVDGDSIVSAGAELAAATVTARVVGEAKGPKITGFTYKNKSNSGHRWGHRQKYARIEITAITKGQ